MARGRYHFHCTDGREALFDLDGVVLRNDLRIWEHAVGVALDAMASCGGRFDWSGWIVDVHDGRGRRVLILAFADIQTKAQHAA
ncbi:DUF6894 family protein [Methylobacterium durans]|uniref:DUF6894 domain-containing protein n=1 Tax=Methylobacterium durans TaxID=2202825 RepID=A0A2U8W4F1_9HYPH|nr:hypothetical protein [Methylobacterium durans]AWN40501.1 hypothetical protein DK389_08110 [Methylobacterium durans]